MKFAERMTQEEAEKIMRAKYSEDLVAVGRLELSDVSHGNREVQVVVWRGCTQAEAEQIKLQNPNAEFRE